MDWMYFFQQFINGLTLGAIYGLIALGYTMVYGIIGMINFAHGEVYMIGAFHALIAYLICKTIGIDSSVVMTIFFMFFFSIFLTSLYGWSLEKIAYRPLRQSQRLASLISAIGMSIFLQNYAQVTQGGRVKPMQPLISDSFTLLKNHDFSVQLSYMQVLIFIVTILLMLVFWYIIQRTSLGRAQRACQQDQIMSSLLGIDVNRTISITFMIGASLAAVAGVMVTLYYGVIDFYVGFLAGIKAFTAAVLGGIGSLPGAILGGLIIGLLEAFWSGYLSIEYKDVGTFSILILVLIFRPWGLFGKPEVEKV